MEHRHASNTTNELEVSDVFFITHARVRVDLQGVVVTAIKINPERSSLYRDVNSLDKH